MALSLRVLYYEQMLSQTWWYMSIILALGMQREEDPKTGQPGLHIKILVCSLPSTSLPITLPKWKTLR